MRIVDRKTFLAMPAGTAFRQASAPFAWRDMMVKGETLMHSETGDWYELALDEIENDGSAQLGDRLFEMLNDGASYPLEPSLGRDGLFDRKAIFLVYEKDDLRRMRDTLSELIDVD
jgi:hypothetical protein